MLATAATVFPAAAIVPGPPAALVPDRPVDTGALDWVPLSAGLSAKPLAYEAGYTGYQALLRVEPGTVVARHRHTGEVHAYHLSGQRLLIDTGEVVGPGAYVYEPPGNVDTWSAVGDQPLIIQVVVHGAVEYLDDADQVVQRVTTSALVEHYRRYCEANGLPMADLFA